MKINRTKNIDNDYIEMLFDLSYNIDFLTTVLNYRKRLGIPKSGFKKENEEYDFLKQNHIEINLIDNEIEKLKAFNNKENDRLLAWNELYSSTGQALKILKDFKIPARARTYLHLFIIYDKRPAFFSEAATLEGAYGCGINFCFSERFPFKRRDLIFDDDLSAILLIYPEATKEDIKNAIDLYWPDIRIIQMEILKKIGYPLRKIKTRTLRKRDEKILKLHMRGLSAPEIAKNLNINKEGSWEEIRKIISRMKNASVIKPLTEAERINEIEKSHKNRPPEYTIIED